jgi:hypothetical protein
VCATVRQTLRLQTCSFCSSNHNGRLFITSSRDDNAKICTSKQNGLCGGRSGRIWKAEIEAPALRATYFLPTVRTGPLQPMIWQNAKVRAFGFKKTNFAPDFVFVFVFVLSRVICYCSIIRDYRSQTVMPRTRAHKNPYGTEANAEGRSVRSCVARE